MYLRITYQQEDYTFQVLKKGPITKDTTRIEVVLNQKNYTLLKNDHQWNSESEVSLSDMGIIQAIGKALSLRYRI